MTDQAVTVPWEIIEPLGEFIEATADLVRHKRRGPVLPTAVVLRQERAADALTDAVETYCEEREKA